MCRSPARTLQRLRPLTTAAARHPATASSIGSTAAIRRALRSAAARSRDPGRLSLDLHSDWGQIGEEPQRAQKGTTKSTKRILFLCLLWFPFVPFVVVLRPECRMLLMSSDRGTESFSFFDLPRTLWYFLAEERWMFLAFSGVLLTVLGYTM